MTQLLDAALALHDAGLCVIPVRADGSKAPAVEWKPYTQSRPDRTAVEQWAAAHEGIGVVTGAVSGHLEMLEFEGRAMTAGYWKRFRDALTDHGMTELGERITTGYAEATPSGGLHLLIRVEGQARRNLKLASRPARDDELTEAEQKVRAGNPGKVFARVLVETRGEGGFVVTAPSAGRTHDTGNPWKLVSGGADTITVITEDERDALYAIASLLDEMPATDPPPAGSAAAATQPDEDVLRPGDDYNARTDWDDILTPHGWTHVANFGQGRAWRRPGKNRGISATTGTRGDRDNLYVFSSSTEFDTERPYSKFGAYALLEHGGNHSAAAGALRRDGYGGDLPRDDDGIEDLIADGPAGDSPKGEAPQPPPRPSIDITDEPAAIGGIANAINGRTFPDTYVRDGRVVEITVPSGSATNLVTIVPVDCDRLRRLLVRHTHTYRMKSTPTTTFPVPSAPAVSTCAAVLTDQEWPGLQPLTGLVYAPVIRPDGTVLQDAGYDEATGLHLAPRIVVPRVPDNPSEADVAEARRFLIDHVLGDFCFDSDASRANYIALLMTPLLHRYFGGMVPFGIFSATTPGSGKTLLVTVFNALYGVRPTAWKRDDEETEKKITAILRDTSEPVVCFDNVDVRATVDHAALSMLLTSRTWSSRILGVSNTFTGINDRLWVCTGNNVTIGGDIASRSVLVKLDPQMERPELRTDFEIADLERWLSDDTNQAELLRAVLTLARAWIATGAPRIQRAMRNFTPWAQAMGGLTGFLGLSGFLGNEAELVDGSDDEETSTAAFLAQWHGMYSTQPKRVNDLLDSARGDSVMGQWHDPWHGTFPARADGRPFSAKGLGRFLGARRGRIFSGLKLIGELNLHDKVWMYRVERVAASAVASFGEAA